MNPIAIVVLVATAAASEMPEKPNPIGLVRTILSAQAMYKHTFPDRGYACSFATLVEARMLSADVDWSKPLGYVLTLDCPRREARQSSFRVAAVPRPGISAPAYCSRDGARILESAGDAATCFEKGVVPK